MCPEIDVPSGTRESQWRICSLGFSSQLIRSCETCMTSTSEIISRYPPANLSRFLSDANLSAPLGLADWLGQKSYLPAQRKIAVSGILIMRHACRTFTIHKPCRRHTHDLLHPLGGLASAMDSHRLNVQHCGSSSSRLHRNCASGPVRICHPTGEKSRHTPG